MQTLRSRCSAVFSLLVIGGALCAAETPRGSFEKTYQVNAPVDLQVFTHSGDISVHKGSSGTVVVKGKIYVGNRWMEGGREAEVRNLEQNPPVHQTGNSIRADYVELKNISISYDITVPAETTVATKSGSGDQVIEGIERPVDISTGSGDVRLHDIKANVQMHTGSGDVEAEELNGRLQAEAGSGNIHLTKISGGDARVQTGSGDIEIRDVNAALEVQTGSGDVTADGAMTGAWDLRTGSGDVQIRLPNQAGFELQATTSSGTVVVDRPITMTIQGNLEHAQKNVRGTVGSGGPRLTLHTGSGDVHIQ